MIRVVYKWGKVLDMVAVIHDIRMRLEFANDCEINNLTYLSVLSFICMALLNA